LGVDIKNDVSDDVLMDIFTKLNLIKPNNQSGFGEINVEQEPHNNLLLGSIIRLGCLSVVFPLEDPLP